MAHSILSTAVALLALLAPPARSQEDSAAPSVRLLSLGMYYLDDQGLHKELNLTADQVKKLAALRKRWYEESWKLNGQDRKAWAEKRRRSAEGHRKALLGILKPGQSKRLREVLMQTLEVSRGFRLFPEVAELGLSEDQKKKLRDNRDVEFEEVLTKEQLAKWKAFKGKPFKGWTAQGFLVRREEHSEPLPFQVVALMHRCVQKELKLSDQDVIQIQDLRQLWRAKTQERSRAEGKDRWERQMEANEVVKDGLRLILSPDKQARLEQIQLQEALKRDGRKYVFEVSRVKEALNLSETQRNQLKDIRTRRQKEFAALFLRGDTYDQVVAKIEPFHEATYKRMLNVLSAAQQKRLQELIGKPFQGTLHVSSDGPNYLASLELEVLGEEAVQSELKMSFEQVRKLVGVCQKYARVEGLFGRGRWADDAAPLEPEERARAINTALNRILLPAQRQRSRQIALQGRPLLRGFSRGGRVVRTNPVEVVEAARDLELTTPQKQKLSHGAEVGEVLTREQQRKWQAMRGEPFKGWSKRRRTRRQLSPLLAFLSDFRLKLDYLEQESVQKELKLSDAQVKGLGEIRKKWKKSLAEGREATSEEAAKKLTGAKALDGDLATLLRPAQNKRFRQILLQQVTGNTQRAYLSSPRPSFFPGGLPPSWLESPKVAAVLGYPLVIRELGLTRAQREELRQLEADARLLRSLAQAQSFRGERELKPEEFMKLTEEKLLGVLTARQKARLKELLGEPFKGEFRVRRFGF